MESEMPIYRNWIHLYWRFSTFTGHQYKKIVLIFVKVCAYLRQRLCLSLGKIVLIFFRRVGKLILSKLSVFELWRDKRFAKEHTFRNSLHSINSSHGVWSFEGLGGWSFVRLGRSRNHPTSYTPPQTTKRLSPQRLTSNDRSPNSPTQLRLF